MTTLQPSPQDMLNDLLLNQALTKRDIARTLSIGIPLIERLLGSDNPQTILEAQPTLRLSRLYHRLKQYEDFTFAGTWQINLSAFDNHFNRNHSEGIEDE